MALPAVVVPAPEEPVKAMIGCLADMPGSPKAKGRLCYSPKSARDNTLHKLMDKQPSAVEFDMPDVHDLGLIIDSHVPLIAIQSQEEPRALDTLTRLAIKRQLPLYAWTVTEGLKRLGFGL